jgi:hypothetical protein
MSFDFAVRRSGEDALRGLSRRGEKLSGVAERGEVGRRKRLDRPLDRLEHLVTRKRVQRVRRVGIGRGLGHTSPPSLGCLLRLESCVTVSPQDIAIGAVTAGGGMESLSWRHSCNGATGRSSSVSWDTAQRT